MPKDWDKICRDIQTPPDSDEEDELNIQKVKKNAQKISDVLHHMMPTLDESLAKGLPRGVNSMAAFSRPFQKLGSDLAAKRGTTPPTRDVAAKGDSEEGTSSCEGAEQKDSEKRA